LRAGCRWNSSVGQYRKSARYSRCRHATRWVTASDHADPDDVGHGSALCHARWKEVEGSGAVEKLIENVVWWCSARR
jgi:hypothetical protein